MNLGDRQVFADVVREVEGRFPEAFGGRELRFSSGVAGVDAALGGGLCRGRLYEWVASAPSSGGSLLVRSLIGAARQEGFLLALVDAADAFDVETADGVEGPSRGFLWARADGAGPAARVADLVLRDPHFGIVVMDLRGVDRRGLFRGIRPAQWYRLQRLAGARGAVLIVLTAVPVAQGVHRRLRLGSSFRLEDFEVPQTVLTERLGFAVAGDVVDAPDSIEPRFSPKSGGGRRGGTTALEYFREMSDGR